MDTVCILGMHRSGTSLLANILRQCGLELGPMREIMEPSKSDNPEGYWENIHFVELNDQILRTLGGSWNRVPALSPGWSSDARLQQIRGQAEGIAWTYAHTLPRWGWKDPRTMLTLEFWQSIIPQMKYVMLVRNPIEVAMSLAKRSDYYVVFDDAIRLWRSYHEVALQTLSLDNCLVVHYDSLQQQTESEVKRIAAYLGMEVTPDQLKSACATVRPALHRNVFPKVLEDLLPFDRESQRLYGQLCSISGPYFESIGMDRSVSEEETVGKAAELLQVMLKGYNDLRIEQRDAVAYFQRSAEGFKADAELHRSETTRLTRSREGMYKRMLDMRRITIERDRANAKAFEERVKANDQRVRRLEDTRRNMEHDLANHRAYIQGKEQQLKELAEHVKGMESSLSWRVTTPLRSIRRLIK